MILLAVPVVAGGRPDVPLTLVEEHALKPKDSFKEGPQCPEMVVVPAGSFMMGSPADEQGRTDSEGPQRKVTFAKAFAVGKFEVTFVEWDACVAAGGCTGQKSPSDAGWGKDRRPVINVSWDDAKEYVAWLSRKTGKPYRLLSEAEWEYAARGVTSAAMPSKRYWWGDSANRKYTNYGSGNTVPVGQFPANSFGLHDVHGNVWEWVEDCWHRSYQGAPTDGSAWITSCTESGRRGLRGGSWDFHPDDLRSATRGGVIAGDRSNSFGVRVGRTLSP
jgi:formylglycine-generating enzyme required for sulfatase activity